MTYHVDLSGFEAHITDNTTLELAVDTLTQYCHHIQNDASARPTFLNLATSKSTLDQWQTLADTIRETFQHVVIIGTGGSSLNPKSFTATHSTSIDIRYLDAIDPHYVVQTLANLDLKQTVFIVISKSGGTTETISHAIACYEQLENAGIVNPNQHFYAITDPKPSPLRRFAEMHSITLLDHAPDIGGRFAGLTVVGLLPAMIAGLCGKSILSGAEEVLSDITKIKGSHLVQSSALIYTLYRQGYQQAVMMVYQNAMVPFGQWFRQICAESLGKEGNGITPLTALGTVDQHSQLQLYLDGPKDKLFSLYLYDTSQQGHRLEINDSLRQAFPELEYIHHKTLGAIHHASGEATATALANQSRPVRIFRFEGINSRLLGALWMHHALEITLIAHLLGINAFDQPAVEEGKRLTRSLLT